MKLTKDQRHTAYIIWLYEWENTLGIDPFMCNTMYCEFDIKPTPEMFPELFKHKPNRYCRSGGWFPTTSIIKRRTILKKCIEETYDF